MESKKVFETINQLNVKKEELEKEKRRLDVEYQNLINLCPHEIVVKYIPNNSKKIMMDGVYYCPACEKILKFTIFDHFNESVFSESKIIDLSGLTVSDDKDTLSTAREEITNNMDLYYGSKISSEVLSFKMRGVLESKQHDHNKSGKILKRIKK